MVDLAFLRTFLYRSGTAHHRFRGFICLRYTSRIITPDWVTDRRQAAASQSPLPGLLGVGFYAEKRRDVIPANAGIQGEYAIVQG